MSYTGEGFSELAFRQVLPKVLRPEVTGGKILGLFPAPGQLQQTSLDPVLTRQWRPLFDWLADGLNLFYTGGALLWSALILIDPKHTDPPLA